MIPRQLVMVQDGNKFDPELYYIDRVKITKLELLSKNSENF